jgi:hypothetical protein
MPTAQLPCFTASIAYSTWNKRPCGLHVVMSVSYCTTSWRVRKTHRHGGEDNQNHRPTYLVPKHIKLSIYRAVISLTFANGSTKGYLVHKRTLPKGRCGKNRVSVKITRHVSPDYVEQVVLATSLLLHVIVQIAWR